MKARMRTCVRLIGVLAIAAGLGGCACLDWCGVFWSVSVGGCGHGFHCH
jgi:hypothetical protein